MDFDLTEEQVQLRDAARKLAQHEFRDKAARWDREEAFPEEKQAPAWPNSATWA
jgi:alkylation response protein AidB-like acyl-CoA dehydrogenase